MGFEDWSEDTILVDLPQEPETGDELTTVTEMVRKRGNCNVVIDFSRLDTISSATIARLLTLREALSDCGHRLTLCSISAATKGIFTITGLDHTFEFADDKFGALAGA